jgi:hypothetical protein
VVLWRIRPEPHGQRSSEHMDYLQYLSLILEKYMCPRNCVFWCDLTSKITPIVPQDIAPERTRATLGQHWS